MAKGQYLSNYQKGIVDRYYEHRDTIFTDKLQTIVSDLAVCTKPAETGKLWARAIELLVKCKLDPASIAALKASKDLQALAKVVGDLTLGKTPAKVRDAASVGGPTVGEGSSPSSPTASDGASAPADAPPAVPAETLKSAMSAFRKRLKLTHLNEESKLSARALTGGKKSQVVAIIPPDQFGAEVWQELARQGKLRYTGQGFYELVE